MAEQQEIVFKASQEGLDEVLTMLVKVEQQMRKMLTTSRQKGGKKEELFNKAELKNLKEAQTNMSLLNKEAKLMKKEVLAATPRTAPPVPDETFTLSAQDTMGSLQIASLKELNPELKKVAAAVKTTTSTYARFGDEVKLVDVKVKIGTRDLRRFRMEMLSVMFFGMALSNIYKEHTARLDEMFGLTDLNAAAMTVLLLPAYEAWADAMMGVNDWILDLGENEKLIIGGAIIGIQKLGEALTTIGQVSLGIDGLSRFYDTIKKANVIGKLTGIYNALTNINTYKNLFGTIKTKFSSMWTWISGHPITTALVIGVGLFLALAKLSSKWGDIKKSVEETQKALVDYQKEMTAMSERLQGYTGDAADKTLQVVDKEALNRLDELNGYLEIQKQKVQGLEDEWMGLTAGINDMLGITEGTELGQERNKLISMENRLKELQEQYDKGFYLDPVVIENSINSLLDDLDIGGSLKNFSDNYVTQYAEMVGGISDTIGSLRAKIPGLSSTQKTELDTWEKQFQGIGVSLNLRLIDLNTAQSEYNTLMDEFEKTDIFGILGTAGNDLVAMSNTMEQVVDPAWERAKESFDTLTGEFSLAVDTDMETIRQALENGAVDMKTAERLGVIIEENMNILSQEIIDGGEDMDEASKINIETQIDSWRELGNAISDGAKGLKIQADESKVTIREAFSTILGGAFSVFETAFDTLGLKIPGFANGGIVTKPTLAMVGESGPEAIVPLSGIGGMGAPTEVNIYINAPISNSNDAQSLVDEVVTRLKREMSMQTFL